MAISIKAKKAMIQRSTFPKPLTNLCQTLAILSGLVHTHVTEELVAQELMTQLVTKAFGIDKINF